MYTILYTFCPHLSMVRRADDIERTQLYFTGKPIPSVLCEKMQNRSIWGRNLSFSGWADKKIVSTPPALLSTCPPPIRYIPLTGHTAARGRCSPLRPLAADRADAPLTSHPTPRGFALSPVCPGWLLKKVVNSSVDSAIFPQKHPSVCGE